MDKYVCIHGHFYQPPRENPWLEEIEVQDSAYPYRDWNERITAECYSPNTAARILNPDKRIIAFINNYSKISFNFGPTLLSWMETHSPEVYRAILQADEESRKLFSGHGTAIAQVYNHMIMPLSNSRDKRTQIIWGIEDFKYRFKRDPRGMWLSETACDLESLDLMAEQGIKFTILAPHQAKRIRKIKGKNWVDVSGGTIDPKCAYLCKLPSGRKINIFFYDGAVSRDLAFGELLSSGENFANRLTGTFTDDQTYPQLVNIATDGETYGHHQRYGDMALAYCLHYIESNNNAKITVYSEYLKKHPPEFEVEIIENTSWSCVHGIERWRNNCGCNMGHSGWNQEWRAPLREALDWLREKLIPIYEKGISKYSMDPWRLRDEYIKVILNREHENVNNYFSKFSVKNFSEDEKVQILKYLELQRHAMLMYTSCGWFFDEVTGIETIQVILYAARAIQLTKELTGINLEKDFVKLLEKAPSNIPEIKNGAKAYEIYVKPAIIDLLRVAAHYAVSSLFEDYQKTSQIFCYEVFTDEFELLSAGKQKLVIGQARMRSRITYEETSVSFAFLHLGDHNINGGVIHSIGEKNFNKMLNEIKNAFQKLNVAVIINLLNKHFGKHNYSLWHLFRDEMRRVFEKIMETPLREIEFYFRQIYENHYPIMQAMKETKTPFPKAITTAVEFVLNKDILKLLEDESPVDQEKLQSLTDEVNKWSVELDRQKLSYAGSKRVNSLMESLSGRPADIVLMMEIENTLRIFNELSLDLNIWKAQNILFNIFRSHYEKMKRSQEAYEKNTDKWIEHFNNLEHYLHVRIT